MRVQELFARGTVVDLEITRNDERLHTAATVAYSLPPNVMGLSFGDMSAAQKLILSNWIAQAIPALRRSTMERETHFSSSEDIPATPAEPNKSR